MRSRGQHAWPFMSTQYWKGHEPPPASRPVLEPVKYTRACLSVGGGPSDDDCICGQAEKPAQAAGRPMGLIVGAAYDDYDDRGDDGVFEYGPDDLNPNEGSK